MSRCPLILLMLFLPWALNPTRTQGAYGYWAANTWFYVTADEYNELLQLQESYCSGLLKGHQRNSPLILSDSLPPENSWALRQSIAIHKYQDPRNLRSILKHLHSATGRDDLDFLLPAHSFGHRSSDHPVISVHSHRRNGRIAFTVDPNYATSRPPYPQTPETELFANAVGQTLAGHSAWQFTLEEARDFKVERYVDRKLNRPWTPEFMNYLMKDDIDLRGATSYAIVVSEENLDYLGTLRMIRSPYIAIELQAGQWHLVDAAAAPIADGITSDLPNSPVDSADMHHLGVKRLPMETLFNIELHRPIIASNESRPPRSQAFAEGQIYELSALAIANSLTEQARLDVLAELISGIERLQRPVWQGIGAPLNIKNYTYADPFAARLYRLLGMKVIDGAPSIVRMGVKWRLMEDSDGKGLTEISRRAKHRANEAAVR